LEVLVQARTFIGDLYAATLTVNDELAMIKRL